MPNVNEAFPSKYLKASDFDTGPELLKMGRSEYEMMGNERKLILYFEDKPKGLVLNKTNAKTIAKLFGDDTEDWRGQQIVAFSTEVDMKGELVPAIRVRAPKPKPNTKAPVARPASADMDDDLSDFR